jgi:hypothetical protein
VEACSKGLARRTNRGPDGGTLKSESPRVSAGLETAAVMIRFVDIGSAEKPKKTAAAGDVGATAASEVATSNPKPAKRIKKPSSLSKATKV